MEQSKIDRINEFLMQRVDDSYSFDDTVRALIQAVSNDNLT